MSASFISHRIILKAFRILRYLHNKSFLHTEWNNKFEWNWHWWHGGAVWDINTCVNKNLFCKKKVSSKDVCFITSFLLFWGPENPVIKVSIFLCSYLFISSYILFLSSPFFRWFSLLPRKIQSQTSLRKHLNFLQKLSSHLDGASKKVEPPTQRKSRQNIWNFETQLSRSGRILILHTNCEMQRSILLLFFWYKLAHSHP